MMTRNDGLWIFIAVVIVDAHGLLVDLLLWYLDLATVTEFARRNFWAAMLILVFNSAGLFGLAVHLVGNGGSK